MRSELGERIFQEIGEDGVLEQLASALYYMSSTVQLMKCPRSRKEKLRPMLADEWADVLMSAGVLGIEPNPDACGGKLISWAKAIGIEVGDEGPKGPPGPLGVWPPFMLVGCAPDEVGPIGKPGQTEREMSDADAQKVTNEVLKSLEIGGTMNTEIKKIKGRLGEAEVLAQLAEECADLAQAALKLRRALDGKNPTPNTEEERRRALIEEYTDVIHCALVLDLEMDLDQIRKKTERWMRRLGME